MTVTEWEKAWRSEPLAPKHPTAGGRTVSAAAVKVALWALASWADYDTGQNARPGVARLATATGLTEQVVRWALEVGRRLGWIVRTSHRPGTGRADVYALTIPDPRD